MVLSGVTISAVLIAIANRCFYIGIPWYKAGRYDVTDLGNLIILGSLFFSLLFSKQRKVLLNPISILVIAFISISILQITLATFYYHQSFLDGTIAIRHSLYFLSFFLFLFLIEKTDKIVRILDIIVVMMFVVFLLSIINYFGPTIFVHSWAEGHGQRLGIKRAFFPAMDLFGFATLWVYCKWLAGEKPRTSGFLTILFVGMTFFRQSRMRILGLLFAAFPMFLMKLKFKHFLMIILVSTLSISALSLTMKQNLIVDSLTGAFDNVVKKTGTWSPRMHQMRIDINEFKKHPIIGSGLPAIRFNNPIVEKKFKLRVTDADLGFTTWLKYYGIIGIFWLICFYGTQIFICVKNIKRFDGIEHTISLLNLAFIVNILASFITLHQLQRPEDIILVCLNAAIIIKLSQAPEQKKLAP